MIAIVLIVLWSLAIGLWSRRFGPAQELLLVGGVIGVLALQFYVFGPS